MVAIGALLLTLKLGNKPMGTSFIPFSAIIAVLIVAFFDCFIAVSKPQNAIQSALCNSHHHAISRYSYQ